MTPLARLCLVSGIGLIGVVPALRAPQSSAAHGQTYVVQGSDTLSAIAMRFHTSAWRLARLNGLADPDHLRIGQVLVVPDGAVDGRHYYESGDRVGVASQPAAPATASSQSATGYSSASYSATSYVVVSGDTLGAVSSRFGVSLAALVGANNLSHPDMLQIGQRLIIPTGQPSTFSAVSTATVRAMPMTDTSEGGTAALATATPYARVPATTLPGTTASRSTTGGLLASQAAAYGIDVALVKAVAWQESGWQMVVAPDGGIGVMQLMPATAAWVGPALLGRAINPYNVTDNIQAGVALLASYLRQYNGDTRLALAAYNEGPQNVARGIGSATAQYITNVLALRASFAQ